MSAETVRATPEGRLRWFSEHDAERDAARAERDVARADLADLRARVAALADELAEDIDASNHQWDKGWDAACRAHSLNLRALLRCPTCGGTTWVPKPGTQGHNLPAVPCLDCTKETP